MGIDVSGHFHIRVAQPFLHILQRPAQSDQHTCTAVAQFMETDVGEFVLFQKVIEPVTYIVRGIGMTVSPFENKGVL